MAVKPAGKSGWARRGMAAGAAICMTAATAPAALAAAAPGPAAGGQGVRLTAAQRSIVVQKFGSRVFLDTGIYVIATGSRLQFDVQRTSYTRPLTINRVIRHRGGTSTVRWPHSTLDGLRGLRNFLHLTITNSAGKTVGSQAVTFCPDDFNPQRATAHAKRTSPFPTTGCASDPFQLGMVWGLQQGWGADSSDSSGQSFRLALGTYQVKESITPEYRRLLHVPAAAATATVTVHVVKGQECCAVPRPKPPAHRPLPHLPAVPTLSHPPASVLPDLIPLPSWGISVQHQRKEPGQAASDQLMFGATVWMSGHARLDVEGFRSHSAPVMQAYQYFWRNGHVIGRARAGIMSFQPGADDNDWHFKQFAQYRLLNAAKTDVLRSHKEGFCIAPTDLVNAFLPGTLWQPNFSTFFSGDCGSQTALSVQEAMPVGWGDTYFQDRPGEDFDITNVPNGTYYIEIIANPEKVLHETDLSNDVSLRKVILGGTTGHRTVRVPAFHGIDPEH
jgi:hypothetical protein